MEAKALRDVTLHFPWEDWCSGGALRAASCHQCSRVATITAVTRLPLASHSISYCSVMWQKAFQSQERQPAPVPETLQKDSHCLPSGWPCLPGNTLPTQCTNHKHRLTAAQCRREICMRASPRGLATILPIPKTSGVLTEI